MATGMFRTGDGSVQVDYDGSNIPVPRSKYEENGYKPDFDELPLEADYWAAQEKAKSSDAKNSQITVIKHSDVSESYWRASHEKASSLNRRA